MDEWKRIAWLLAGIVIGAGWAYAASWHWLHDVDVRDEMERATAQVSYRSGVHVGIADWFSGLFDDGSSDREECLLAADEMQGKVERAQRKLDAANREADRASERHTEAMDREYAATLKASLVADRLVVVTDRLWAADANGRVDPGMKLANWDDEVEELAHISHGLEMLHQRFEEQREQAESDAREWERKAWMAIARGNDLEQQIRKYSERYDEAIQAAGL